MGRSAKRLQSAFFFCIWGAFLALPRSAKGEQSLALLQSAKGEQEMMQLQGAKRKRGAQFGATAEMQKGSRVWCYRKVHGAKR